MGRFIIVSSDLIVDLNKVAAVYKESSDIGPDTKKYVSHIMVLGEANGAFIKIPISGTEARSLMDHLTSN